MIIKITFFDVVILTLGRNQRLFQVFDKFLCQKRFFSIKKKSTGEGFFRRFLFPKKNCASF